MSLYVTLGNLLALTLHVVHFSFYFPMRKPKWLAIPAGVWLLMLPFFIPSFGRGNFTDYYWPLQIIAYAFYCAAVFRLVMFDSSTARVVFGVFLVGSFACVILLCNHFLFLAVFGWSAEPQMFEYIRIGQLLLYLVALPFLYKYARLPIKAILDRADQQKWHTVILPPMLIYVLGYLAIAHAHAYPGFLTAFLAAVAIGVIVIYYTSAYNSIVQDRRTQFLTEVIESYNKMLPYFEAHNAELLQKEKALRTIRHDLRHVLGGLTLAARDGDMEALLSVVRMVSEMEDDATALWHFSDNKAVDGVVSFHFSMAARQGVHCSARLFLPEPLGLPQAEVAMLFGNALENCVKAAGPLGESGRIAVSAKVVKDCLVIRTVNNFVMGESKRGEGLGLTSMRMVCERHQGRLDAEVVGDELRLTAILKRDVPPDGGDARETEGG